MKRISLAVLAALALGVGGVAFATPATVLIQNGDFSTVSFGSNERGPTQFGPGSGGCDISGRSYGAQIVDSWTGGSGYQIYYPSASDASGTQECTQYGNTGNQLLPTSVTAPAGGGAFVGLDGQNGIQGQISQTIDGLTVGKTYKLTFDWASTQELSRDGASWTYLQVGFGKDTQYTSGFTPDIASNIKDTPSGVTANEIESHGFSGWGSGSMTFTATSTSQLLSFMGFGGQVLCNGQVFYDSLSSCKGTLSTLSLTSSTGLPPFALLANVDLSEVTAVPEPPELALFGLGLLGLGVLTIGARRRALRHQGEGGDDNVA